VSDRWLHAETVVPVTLQKLLLPDERTSNPTNLLPLRPLPVTALQDPRLETLYGAQFMFFNSVQTQVFHTLYHGTMNVMVGAPTGSGKTIIAELAIWNALRTSPQSKIVYVAPLKALIKERLEDWTRRFTPLGIKVIELSGDVSPDLFSLQNSKIIVTTPEKWDSITRGQGKLASQISLMVLDEIHLLGGDRGHVLEMIVTRMCRQTAPFRLVGLSTALANATDMSNWLQIPDSAMFNFRPSVRPVPLEVRIEGYAGRHYCPRMATMNKPTYSAILSHSPNKPVLVFVSSRRQTRLTANALVAHCVNDGFPRRFVQCPEDELDWMIADVTDASLRHALSFGIALHHAGLTEADRRVSETLFAAGKVQVMVATSTLAWGLNFPAHLVVVKGTEFYDARSHSYVDVPLTDVMQMIGRAGRPQFDQQAKAVILVQDIKKDF
jgi:replicative superfamily II helicase